MFTETNADGGPNVQDVSESYALRIGNRTHRVIGAVLAEGVANSRTSRAMQVTKMTAKVLGDFPIQHKRERAALMEVSTTASTYLQRFLLDPDWEFQGAEVTLGGGRADLVFRRAATGEWLVDEIKTSSNRIDDAQLRPQINRYLEGGAARWGELFVGVRLCALGLPHTSRLFIPTSKRAIPLDKTSLAGGVA